MSTAITTNGGLSVGGLDSGRLQLHRPQPQRDVPYVPTDPSVAEAMLDLADVGPGDVVYDLGCGDGRIVIAAARRGARAVGVDIDLQRIHESQENARRYGASRGVQFIRDSFFNVDLRNATVVMLYLLPSINLKLRPKLLFELAAGARIVSNNFDMKDWPADATAVIAHRILYKWLVPAWVAGRWTCYMNHPAGRRRAVINFRRHLNRLHGEVCLGGRNVMLWDGQLIGRSIRFTLWHPEHLCPSLKFIGRVNGNQMRGVCRSDSFGYEDQPAFEWCALRQQQQQ